MKNEFVPYDIALAMKELGFDEPCFGFYSLHDDNKAVGGNYPCDGTNSAPLYQQAFRWLLDLVNKDLPYTDNYSISFDNKYWTIRLGGCTMEVDKSQDACLRKLIEIIKER